MARGRATGARVAALLFAVGLMVPGRALQEEPPPAADSGQKIDWEGWSFRWSIRRREGPVLTDVSFHGRPVLKYAALAEIFVPYHPGKPRPEDFRDGVGKNLAELIPGQDCLPGTSCQMLNARGKPEGKRVVGIHEESTGPLYVGDRGRAYGKMLVLWCASRLGGYTYFIRWRFRNDGFILPEVGLTGQLEHTRAGPPPAGQGSIVERKVGGSQLHAPAHVHNFYYRLDFDIDGPEHDTVEEMTHRQDVPGRSLSSHDFWTPITRESGRSLDSAAFRSWRVVDKFSTNALGRRRSFELIPGGNGIFRGGEGEPFTQADLWVTRYHPREFPFTASDPRALKDSLHTYLNNEPVADENVVVWYSMHVHHLPRTEDWPAMPVEWMGFRIAPRDFLDTSPLQPR